MIANITSRRNPGLLAKLPHASILALVSLIGFAQSSPAQGQPNASQQRHSAPQEDSKDLQPIQSMLQQGRVADAKAAIETYLQQHTQSVQAYNLLGIIDSNQQDFEGALAAFQKALKLAPNSARTHVNLGNVYLVQKKADLADKEFRVALNLDPQDQDANYNLAILLMAKGSYAQAIPLLQHIHPITIPARFNLIRAYFETKRTEEALRIATELSSENENSVQVHFSLGLLLASKQQPKAAQAELLKADTLAPNTLEILLNLGTSFAQSGDSTRAASMLSRALELKPNSPETLYWLAKTSQAQSQPLDALDYLIRARKLAPNNPDILLLMAQISMAQNYYEDAIPLLESGVKLAPNRSDFHAALGECYFMADKADQAIAEFKRWIEIEPSARSYAFLGIAYRSSGHFEEAIKSFEQGLKLDPNSSICKFNLGFIAERRGDTATAEARFIDVLKTDPNYPDALLELANLRIAAEKFPEAEQLLKKYVQLNPAPSNLSTGYYKLATVERSLHETAASARDLAAFQSLSKDAAPTAHVSEHLFDYLDTRSKLAPVAREQLDLDEITEQVKKHPDQPEALYLLVSAYLKAGKIAEAKSTLADLDKASTSDSRTLIGTGVLLARYHLYDEAIQHFQSAIAANASSSNLDEAYFDLADAYFRKGLYAQALDATKQVSAQGQTQDANLSLMADIYAHLGDATRAEEMYRDAITRNPDNDQDYLSLSLLQFRSNDLPGAKQTLLKGQSRVPASGKIVWGLAIASALEGKTPEAAAYFERAVELLPEWSGSYSTLGFFYYETGQIDKAREVTNRFKNNRTNGGLDLNRIGQTLAQSAIQSQSPDEPLTPEKKQQLLQLALSLADKTL